MIEYPLTKQHRIQLARAFRHVPRVDLSIQCVLEGQMGRAFVDNLDSPAIYQIDTGPFFYGAGDATSAVSRDLLERLPPYTFLMPSAPGWLEAARQFHGDKLIELERYSFSSASLSADHLRGLYRDSPFCNQICMIDQALAASLWGQEHFIDLSSYESPEDFLTRGIGFYVARGDKVVAAAYAALVCSTGIEVSLFVVDKYRRQGMATALSSRLLLWCLENGMDAHWDAANPESARLAKKLGYVPTGQYQAYFLQG